MGLLWKVLEMNTFQSVRILMLELFILSKDGKKKSIAVIIKN